MPGPEATKHADPADQELIKTYAFTAGQRKVGMGECM
jgi:hypothetical protein